MRRDLGSNRRKSDACKDEWYKGGTHFSSKVGSQRINSKRLFSSIFIENFVHICQLFNWTHILGQIRNASNIKGDLLIAFHNGGHTNDR